MKDLKYCVFWIVIIYGFFLGVGYLVSFVWNESLRSVTSNAMLLSIGFMFGTFLFKYKTR